MQADGDGWGEWLQGLAAPFRVSQADPLTTEWMTAAYANQLEAQLASAEQYGRSCDGVMKAMNDDLERAKAIMAKQALRAEGLDIEALAAKVHQAYLDTCARLGWPVKPENLVAYADLSEDSKELDRASVRAVLAALAEKGE